MSSNNDDDWDTAFAAHPDPAGAGDDGETAGSAQDGPKPFFADVEQWVTHWLTQVICRPQPNSLAWCPEWWAHAEAISRLEALWRAWEHLRLDGTTGMSVWWRDHFEPHWSVLTDVERGPFAECHNGHSDRLQPLPTHPAPTGWWGPPTADAPSDLEGPPA